MRRNGLLTLGVFSDFFPQPRTCYSFTFNHLEFIEFDIIKRIFLLSLFFCFLRESFDDGSRSVESSWMIVCWVIVRGEMVISIVIERWWYANEDIFWISFRYSFSVFNYLHLFYNFLKMVFFRFLWRCCWLFCGC